MAQASTFGRQARYRGRFDALPGVQRSWKWWLPNQGKAWQGAGHEREAQ
jgi:hypothetical protein